MPLGKGVRFRIKRTGKTTGVRLGFKGNKAVEHKKVRLARHAHKNRSRHHD